ncbi:MAG: hypothetical protein AMJ60_04430 [Desulfobacterales bacterium SG8_35]|nr:MAG: hypothetical protein AMJ60_04430 [Desulfobacterales bacterium SG8_35]
MPGYLWTGQASCYDSNGTIVPCKNSGQDGEFQAGIPWPLERFIMNEELVLDQLTGLQWLKNANPAEFPVTWQEALDYVAGMNREEIGSRTDWRLPNRRELRSLMTFEARKPALPAAHPFENVFLGWYWTSSTAAINPAYAWYVHMEGARMFFGRKDQHYLFWPVCGRGRGVLPLTGQNKCFDAEGSEISCRGTGQDGELQMGLTWPEPRFVVKQAAVLDKLTGLYWLQDADAGSGKMNWQETLHHVKNLDLPLPEPSLRWRLPSINELESLVDCSRHSPALPADHPFANVRDVYWSSTTSFFEQAWAWALYLHKGATGVGFKLDRGFHLWPVASQAE